MLPPARRGALAAGTYEYGVSARTARGETPASTSVTTVAAAGASACSGARYARPRATTSTAAARRRRVGAHRHRRSARQPRSRTPARSRSQFSDAGAAGTAASPPTGNTAAAGPVRARTRPSSQRSTSTGVKYTGSDTSKPYPQTPSQRQQRESISREPPGSRATRRPSRAIRPTSTTTRRRRTQQLDEYNWIYVADNSATPEIEGNCQAIPDVTTCRTTHGDLGGVHRQRGPDHVPARRRQRSAPALLPPDQHRDDRHHARRHAVQARGRAEGAVHALLRRQRAARAAQHAPDRRRAGPPGQVAAGQPAGPRPTSRTARCRSRRPTGTEVPLTGTNVGTSYGGHKSGWSTVSGSAVFQPSDPANTVPPSVTGSVVDLGGTLTANPGTWSGTPTIAQSVPVAALQRPGRSLPEHRRRDGVHLPDA